MSIKSEVVIPFVHPVYVRSILDCLQNRGVPPSDVLAGVGLAWKDLRDGSPFVDFSVFRRFVARAIQCSGEPALGLIAGAMFQPYHTPMGIAAVTSDNLGLGLRFAIQNAKLIIRGMDFQLDNGPRWSTLKVRPMRPLCETQVFVLQSILGALLRLVEAILGRPVDEHTVGLPYARPPGPDLPYFRYARTVEFDQQCLTFQLPVNLLRSPSASADAKAFLVAVQACRKMESELGQVEFIQRVRQALQERLAANPELSELAPDLGVSARTLVRRLAESRLTYSDIKDDLRKSHAAWYLQHTELSIKVVASQLGYNDPTNFSRKFKDWYCMPPSKMRSAVRSGLN